MAVICFTVMFYEKLSLEILFFPTDSCLYCRTTVLRQKNSEIKWSNTSHKFKASVFGKPWPSVFMPSYSFTRGPGNVFGIEIGYGLDGPEIESW